MNPNNLNELLIEAMNSEKKAQEFYENASLKAKSQAGKKLFKELGQFENNHYNRIKKIIESKNNKIIYENEDVKKLEIRSEIEGEIEPNKDEIVDILNLAIESEKKAHDRYKKISNLFDDDMNKSIFNNLALEERNHQKILEDQFYHMSNKGTIIWE